VLLAGLLSPRRQYPAHAPFGSDGYQLTFRSALAEVQSILKDFLAINTKTAEMYKKNLSLALLEVTFRLPQAEQDPDTESKGMTPRVVQTGLFLEGCFDKLSAFDDVKGYVSDLSFKEAKAFMERVLPKMLAAVSFTIIFEHRIRGI